MSDSLLRSSGPTRLDANSSMFGHVVGAYLAAALLLGGGGVGYPLLTAFIEAGALLLLVGAAFGPGRLPAPPRPSAALVLLILLVPLLQLVPLPYDWWVQLPGRETAAQILEASGAETAWRPLSLDPEATARSALALLPGLALFLIVPGLGLVDRRRLILVVIVAATISAALGALQKASGGTSAFAFFPSSHSPYAPGLFVNRNHQGTFLQVAMLLAAAMPALAPEARRRAARFAAGGIVLLFAAGSLATTSRSALISLPFALGLSALLLFPLRLTTARIFGVMAGVAALSYAAMQTGLFQIVLRRFSAPEEARFTYWSDSWVAIQQFWPWGSGLGTFRTVFPTVERLDIVAAANAYNAHNDYLELLLETGFAAIPVFLVFLAWLAWRAVRLHAAARSGLPVTLALAALGGILLILAASIPDYPLRMLSIMALLGLLGGLASPMPPEGSAKADAATPGRASRRAARRVLAAVAAVPILYLLAVIGMTDRALNAGQPRLALRVAPHSPEAGVAAAAAAIGQQRHQEARSFARRAVAASPLNGDAVAILALAEEGSGRLGQARDLMALAGILGWRNHAAQLWIMHAALAEGDVDTAVFRADALLRQRIAAEHVYPFLRGLAESDAGAAAIAGRLAAAPAWRPGFLGGLHGLEPAHFAGHEAVLLSLRRSASPPTEAEIGSYLNRIIALRSYDRARRFWTQWTGSSRAVADASFGRIARGREIASPLGWRDAQMPGVALDSAVAPDADGGPSLHLTARGALSGPVLEHVAILPPGRYRLSVRAREEAAGSLAALDWRIRCIDEGSRIELGVPSIEPASEGWQIFRRSFSIPAAGCPAQHLGLSIDNQGNDTVEAWFDDFEIMRTGGSAS